MPKTCVHTIVVDTGIHIVNVLVRLFASFSKCPVQIPGHLAAADILSWSSEGLLWRNPVTWWVSKTFESALTQCCCHSLILKKLYTLGVWPPLWTNPFWMSRVYSLVSLVLTTYHLILNTSHWCISLIFSLRAEIMSYIILSFPHDLSQFRACKKFSVRIKILLYDNTLKYPSPQYEGD